MINLAILGSTGSIGTQTLEVVRRHRDRYSVQVLTTNGRLDLLARQIEEFEPSTVVVGNEELADTAWRRFGVDVEVLSGEPGLVDVSGRDSIDMVVSGLVGFAGLAPTIAAVERGKRVALANKETLVVAGEIIGRMARSSGSVVLPIDSEHSAIHQCLVGEDRSTIEVIVLTASGGPFRDTPIEEFDAITSESALRHPNWSMGPKITIDSATMMNKGLEVIEARWLFDLPPARIQVVVHPQSIVHSLVQFVDGSVKAQMGLPDMRLPIQYALSYPERLPNEFKRMSLPAIGRLTFLEPDLERFPALGLAYQALGRGGTAPAILNAANEIAVAAFLSGTLGFTGIPRMIERALSNISVIDKPELRDVLDADARTREELRSYLAASPSM